MRYDQRLTKRGTVISLNRYENGTFVEIVSDTNIIAIPYNGPDRIVEVTKLMDDLKSVMEKIEG